MEVLPGSKKKAVGELLSQVLSRDAVEYNACINANFSSNVAYTGHGLKFQGASNLKHASWLFNAVITGQPATFDLKDIEWDEKSNSATVHSVRYVRPRFFPFIGFAVPVETHLRFNADGGEGGSSASESKLYVTKFEDHWPTDQLIKSVPVFGAVYTTLFTPIATLIWLTLSNFAFVAFSRASSSKRHYVDPSLNAVSGRVEKSLPKDVAKNVNTGFKKGTSLAEGWGDSLVQLISRITYPVLSPVEMVAQRSVSALPLPLPYPYIYDAHSQPPAHPARKLTAMKEKKEAASANSNGSSSTAPAAAKSVPPTQSTTDEKNAEVQVLPAVDGTDQGKVVDIAHRNNNESKDTPAPALQSKGGESLYDQLRKEGQLPTAEETEKLTRMTQSQALAGNSSEEEESGHGHATGTNGVAKKKKSGNKKKKAGVSHPPPPSFKEGLQHAEEQEHQAHH